MWPFKGLLGTKAKPDSPTAPQRPQSSISTAPAAKPAQSASRPSEPTNDVVEFMKAGPSQVFPDFPLNPQDLFYKGGVMKDGYLLNIATIGLCICGEFETLRSEVSSQRWPSYADRELGALKRAYERMHANVPSGIRHSVNVAEVRRLARAYIERVKNSETVYAQFMGARVTLFNMSVDFANTIACGPRCKQFSNGINEFTKRPDFLEYVLFQAVCKRSHKSLG